MESQIERVLTVLMNKVVEGIPDGKGGYLERPIDSEAAMFLDECGGQIDAAVAAAARDIFLRKPNWSESVWRGALLVVVGQVPLVGSPAAIFYSQFESIWKQIRFVSLAATMYGHDVREDATQCQIILCLMDDTIRKANGPLAMDQIYSKGMKSGVQVAATIIARQVVAKGGTSFLMKRVLGGLLIGVMPEAVGVLYTVLWTGKMTNHAEMAIKAKELNSRAKAHFKKDEQPGMTVVVVSFLVWFVPVLGFNFAKAWNTFDKVFGRLLVLTPLVDWPMLAPLVDALSPASQLLVSAAGDDDEGPPLIAFCSAEHSGVSCEVPAVAGSTFDTPVLLSYALAKLMLATLVIFSAYHVVRVVSKSRTWLVSSTGLGVRALLNFVSASNTATSLARALLSPNYDGVYHAHRAAVGLFTLASRFKKDLKPVTPFVVGSLLVWILYNVGLCVVNYVQAFAPLIVGDAHDLTAAMAGVAEIHAELAESGFAWARLKDAIDATCTISLHILVEEIRRPDVIMTMMGPKKVVTGMLFAAKSLGHVVANPKSVLFWLDKATPPVTISWALLAAQYSATFLGLACGLLAQSGVVTKLELVLLSYCVFLSIPFYLWQKTMPPPYDDQVWAEALKSRHRLLYLIPELDSKARSRIYFAINFFEHYDFAVTSSKEYASYSFVKVKDWVATSFSKREKQELRRLGRERSNSDPLEFDASIYQDENDGWMARVSAWVPFWDSVTGRSETIEVNTAFVVDEPDMSREHTWTEWLRFKVLRRSPSIKATPDTDTLQIRELGEGEEAMLAKCEVEDKYVQDDDRATQQKEQPPLAETLDEQAAVEETVQGDVVEEETVQGQVVEEETVQDAVFEEEAVQDAVVEDENVQDAKVGKETVRDAEVEETVQGADVVTPQEEVVQVDDGEALEDALSSNELDETAADSDLDELAAPAGTTEEEKSVSVNASTDDTKEIVTEEESGQVESATEAETAEKDDQGVE
ncbi:Uncharacterized protein SCF082_LOCUS50632 [Durusdinium trenchii]|uniref:Uncharacterized protein n=1 Tax=Durusdinium trenchii TaxID=1381693 RepID=A0ABP0S992_9DINO